MTEGYDRRHIHGRTVWHWVRADGDRYHGARCGMAPDPRISAGWRPGPGGKAECGRCPVLLARDAAAVT